MTLQTPAAESPAPSDNPQPPTKKASLGWITPVLGVVAALVIGLLGGVFIGQNTSATQGAGSGANGANLRDNQGFANRPSGETGQGGFSSGTIDSIDGNTMVITLADGTKLTVAASDSTTVSTMVSGTVDDLAVGERITVVGEKSGDTVTATAITEGNQFGGQAGRPDTTPAPTENGQ